MDNIEKQDNLKNQLSKDVNVLLRDFIDRQVSTFEGNFYVGKVVNNVDNDKQGKCQIRVYGLFDEIPDNDLPWAMMDNSFVGSKVGGFIVPPIGCIVRVRFENGDIYSPVYSTKVIDLNNKLSKISNLNFNGDPNTLIFFVTDDGEYFKINKTTKETEYRTATGDSIKIDSQGNIEINTTNVSTPLQGKITINTKADVTVNVDKSNQLGTVTVNSPNVKFIHDVLGTVTPNPTGGPFCALPLCIYSGANHQGTDLKNI
jgi:hypothetical protein